MKLFLHPRSLKYLAEKLNFFQRFLGEKTKENVYKHKECINILNVSSRINKRKFSARKNIL